MIVSSPLPVVGPFNVCPAENQKPDSSHANTITRRAFKFKDLTPITVKLADPETENQAYYRKPSGLSR